MLPRVGRWQLKVPFNAFHLTTPNTKSNKHLKKFKFIDTSGYEEEEEAAREESNKIIIDTVDKKKQISKKNQKGGNGNWL